MENTQIIDALKDTQNVLSELYKHAKTQGSAIEGEVIGFVKNSASGIEKFVMNAGDEIVAAGHAMQLDQLTELFHRMYEMIDHNALLASFWEDMVQEIPDLIEWAENVMAKGGEAVSEAVTTAGEAVTQAAETAGEVVTQVAETAGEVAIQVAEVAGETALEASDVIAAVATEI